MEYPDEASVGDAKREAQVTTQLVNLERAICSAQKSQEALCEKLHPVLRVEPTCDNSEGKVAEELVPLAAELRRMAEVVRRLAVRNEDLIGLLEI